MKARIKSTGEIIEVYSHFCSDTIKYYEIIDDGKSFSLKMWNKIDLDFNINNMEEIKIQVPEGMEIDLEKSSLEKGIVKFKKKEVKLPKSWEEVDEHNKHKIERYFTYRVPEKYEALLKLEILRDIYRQGWIPDYTSYADKYVIYYYNNKIDTTRNTTTQYFLSFQSKEIRDKFLRNFKDLIEECKDFI